MKYSYLGNQLSNELEGYLTELLPGFPDLNTLSRRIVTKVIEEKEKDGSDVIEISPDLYLLALARSYAKRISDRYFQLFDVLGSYMKSAFRILMVVGAGLSYESGLPLTEQLKGILRPLGYNPSDYNGICDAFKDIRKYPSKEEDFKERFKNLIEKGDVKVGKCHEIISKNFFKNKIQEILCLNWDNLIEKSYLQGIGGTTINKIFEEPDGSYNVGRVVHALWKLNGDVDNPKSKWVYPGEDGQVFEKLDEYFEYLSKQSDFTYISLAVGYSESDENINDLVKKIEMFSKFYRLGMDMRLFSKYDDYLLAPAEWVLPMLLSIS